jgi:hypothetical protein
MTTIANRGLWINSSHYYRGNRRRGGGSSSVICFRCRQSGHISSNCTQPIQQKKRTLPPSLLSSSPPVSHTDEEVVNDVVDGDDRQPQPISSVISPKPEKLNTASMALLLGSSEQHRIESSATIREQHAKNDSNSKDAEFSLFEEKW